MSDRLRNNVIAGFIVVAFWIVFVLPVMAADTIVTDSTSVVTTSGNQKTEVISPPPSAIAPQFGSGNNSDLCTISSSGSVQTQILGISTGQAYSDENCMRLKNAKVLYDMGMKVAAVALMCQTRSVYDAMKFAGTPCPINSPTTGEGLIGQEATAEWRLNPKKIPKKQQTANMDRGVFLEKLVSGIIGVILLAILMV